MGVGQRRVREEESEKRLKWRQIGRHLKWLEKSGGGGGEGNLGRGHNVKFTL